VVDLLAKSPGAADFPLRIGTLSAQETDLGPLTSVMPFKGQHKAVAAALGMDLPGPGQSVVQGAARLLWFGRGQYLGMGAEITADLSGLAAVTDQSDAWCCVTLSGAQVDAVLARLVPVDLRLSQFAPGAVVRSQIGHMNGALLRLDAAEILLMVFRSMARTLAHEVKEAMETVTALR